MLYDSIILLIILFSTSHSSFVISLNNKKLAKVNYFYNRSINVNLYHKLNFHIEKLR
jgi:hypothetical protein